MQGQHMKEGIHFNDTHAPVPSPTVVRLFFALTAAGGRHFTQVDVKTAFLTAPLDIELDVILPTGFGRKREVGDLSSRSHGGDALLPPFRGAPGLPSVEGDCSRSFLIGICSILRDRALPVHG